MSSDENIDKYKIRIRELETQLSKNKIELEEARSLVLEESGVWKEMDLRGGAKACESDVGIVEGGELLEVVAVFGVMAMGGFSVAALR